MRYIKYIGLGNVRVFDENVKVFKLNPITILTGPNSSGKSTLVKAFMLFKELNTATWPYCIKLDSMNNTLGSFELIKNSNAGKDALPSFYLKVFIPILNENLLVVFYASKSEKAHEIRIEEIRVLNNSEEILFNFKTDETNSFVYNINYEFFRDRLVYLINNKEKYESLENLLDVAKGDKKNKVRCYFENDYKQWREKLIKSGIRTNELIQLGTFFTGGKFKEIKEFNQNDHIFNFKYLDSILKLSKRSLTVLLLKEHLLKTVLDQRIKNRIKKDEIDLNEIVNMLLVSDYDKFEHEQFHQISMKYLKISSDFLDILPGFRNPVLSGINFMGAEEFHPFYKSLSEISTEYSLLGGITVKENQKDLGFEKIKRFSLMVYEDIIEYIKKDINEMFCLSLGNIRSERIVSYDNPWHNLIKLNENKKNQDFIKKWFKEFIVCEDIIFEQPVAGLGYAVYLVKNGEKISLFDEGSGANHILNLILNFNCLELYREENDYSKYHWIEENHNLVPRTVLVEEPEVNLHPAWQSKIADLIVDAMETLGLHLVIETHSEYLVRKLQYLVAKKKLESEKVQIIYFDNPSKEERSPGAEQMFSIKIEENGILSSEFGPGFFDEADNLAIQLLSLNKAQNN